MDKTIGIGKEKAMHTRQPRPPRPQRPEYPPPRLKRYVTESPTDEELARIIAREEERQRELAEAAARERDDDARRQAASEQAALERMWEEASERARLALDASRRRAAGRHV